MNPDELSIFISAAAMFLSALAIVLTLAGGIRFLEGYFSKGPTLTPQRIVHCRGDYVTFEHRYFAQPLTPNPDPYLWADDHLLPVISRTVTLVGPGLYWVVVCFGPSSSIGASTSDLTLKLS